MFDCRKIGQDGVDESNFSVGVRLNHAQRFRRDLALFRGVSGVLTCAAHLFRALARV